MGYGDLSSELASILQESLDEFDTGTRLMAGRTRKLIQGERRRVAVLFLDLTGYTGLAESLDHETLHTFTGRLMGLLSSLVESYGGYVDKIEGDRIMALFGALSAAENDSARAVSCAIRMMDILQEAVPPLPGDRRLSARAGIHFGPVTVAPDPTGHLTATGSTVNIAARLESLSSPGGILVTDEVRKQCGNLIIFQSAGSFPVKGLSHELTLFRPAGPGKDRIERWERGARLLKAPLVNRRRELGILQSALKEVRDSKTKVLLRIVGQAGIGKSRLLHRIMSDAEGFMVLHGHAERYAQTPFGIWIDMLGNHICPAGGSIDDMVSAIRKLARDCSNRVAAEKLAEVSQTVAEILCRETGLENKFNPNEGKDRAIALKSLLEVLGNSGPLMVALEDIHWMDESSAMVLQRLIESTHFGRGILVAATERPLEGSPDLSDYDWRVLQLDSLGDSEIRSISSYLLSDEENGASFDEELTGLLTDRSRGNPFFAEELVLSLLELGGIARGDDGVWHLTIEQDLIQVPSAVKSLVQSRLDWLPGPERKVLQLASVIGPTFRRDVLRSVVSKLHQGIELHRVLDTLIRKGYLVKRNDEQFQFRHDLVQSSVYGTLLKHNRKILHRMTAEAYQEVFPEGSTVMASVIYNQWRRTGDGENTLKWGLKALLEAEINEQYNEVLSISSNILRLVEENCDIDPRAKCQALISSYGASHYLGDLEGAWRYLDSALDEAHRLEDPSMEAMAMKHLITLKNETGDHDGIPEIFHQAIHKATLSGDEVIIAKVISSMANHLSDIGMHEEALEKYRSALEMFERHSITESVAAVKANVGNLLSRMGDTEAAGECFRESIRLCRELGMRASLGYSLNGYAIIKAMENDLDTAESLFLEALDCQRDLGNLPPQSSILNNLGVLSKLKGDLETSMRYRMESLEVARRTGSKRSEGISLLNVGSLYRILGEMSLAEKYIRHSLKVSIDVKDAITQCHALGVLGMIMAHTGRDDQALENYSHAAAIIDEMGIHPGHVEDFDQLLEMLRESHPDLELPRTWSDDTGRTR